MLEKTYSRKKVTPRQLPLKYRIILVLGSTILVYLYSLFLNLIGGDNVLIDAASTLCSVIATILMALRFREQWFMWIIVYLISIIMWIVAFDILMLIMSICCFLSSLIGYINWKVKIAKNKVSNNYFSNAKI